MLVGWGGAGFYPCWWEYASASRRLADQFPDEMRYPAAREWWDLYVAVCETGLGGDGETRRRVEEYLAGQENPESSG
ncbi:hypothetical protein GGR56DRAFT_651296 [Xylariaceae sp. FL0804]|nr:hypothetical protein GGR56DRAFT_651296 [Xylariaceae sp. FL0804]